MGGGKAHEIPPLLEYLHTVDTVDGGGRKIFFSGIDSSKIYMLQ